MFDFNKVKMVSPFEMVHIVYKLKLLDSRYISRQIL